MIIDEVVDNGIAFIPCKVSGIDGIICRYSLRDHETLDGSFAEYVKSYADTIPTKYPIALAICSHKFISKEQKIIAETIKDYFIYELGLIQNILKWKKVVSSNKKFKFRFYTLCKWYHIEGDLYNVFV